MTVKTSHSILSTVTLLALGLVLTLPMTGCFQEASVEKHERTLVSEPVLNVSSSEDDFAFPSRPPRLSMGKVVFEQNCAQCHAIKHPISYTQIKTEMPIDTYLMLTRGDHGHPSFRKLDRDARWEAIFYARYLGGGADIKTENVAALFGGNCAVCHGPKGFADGPLFSGHSTAHELGMAPVKMAFTPPPANFHFYPRMYNRTDDQLVKRIQEGIYPSAMPSFAGRDDKAKNITFTEPVIRDLVKYIRTFSYENDLPAEGAAAPSGASKELSAVMPDHLGKLE